MKSNKTLGYIFLIIMGIVFYYADKGKEIISSLEFDIEHACMELVPLTERYSQDKNIQQLYKDICNK